MKKLSRILAGFLSLLLSISMLSVPAGAASSQAPFYNIDLAIDYAEKHWRDPTGECAHFVSSCVSQSGAGIFVPNRAYFSPDTPTYDGRTTLGGHTNPFISSTALLVWFAKNGFEIVENPTAQDIQLGDVVFMRSPNGSPDGHTVLITKKDMSGKPYFSAHNEARHLHPLPMYLVTYVVRLNGYRDITATLANKKVQISNGSRYVNAMLVGDLVNALNRYHPLWRRSSTTFTVHLTPDGWVGLQSSSGKFLTAERDLEGLIKARGDKLQAWEAFRVYRSNNGSIVILSQITGKLLSMTGDDFHANASKVSASTKFKLNYVL